MEGFLVELETAFVSLPVGLFATESEAMAFADKVFQDTAKYLDAANLLAGTDVTQVDAITVTSFHEGRPVVMIPY
jgi:hypothetical protein